MRISRGFIIGIVAFFIAMFALQLSLPQRFSWSPTFSRKDKNPFGCYVFDSVMSHTLSRGYSVAHKTLYQISHEKEPVNVLVITTDINMSKTDVEAVNNIARKGGTVMIVGGRKRYNSVNDSLLCAHWDIGFRYVYFDISSLRKKIKSDASGAYDTLFWNTGVSVYKDNMYPVYSMLTETLENTDSVNKNRVLAFVGDMYGSTVDKDGVVVEEISADTHSDVSSVSKVNTAPVVISRKVGKGEIIFVSTPLLFTNYGILDKNTAGYVFRLMSYIADKPVVRTTAYMKTADMEEADASPLRFFLSKPPLRTALYLTLFVIVLFMIFTARRRQRVIPVIESPRNRSLEFVQLIGTLYFHNKDHADLVRKKYRLFAGELQRLLMLDITDTRDDGHAFTVISVRTGIPRDEVENIIKDIRSVADRKAGVTEYGMRQYIDNMNMIISKIT